MDESAILSDQDLSHLTVTNFPNMSLSDCYLDCVVKMLAHTQVALPKASGSTRAGEQLPNAASKSKHSIYEKLRAVISAIRPNDDRAHAPLESHNVGLLVSALRDEIIRYRSSAFPDGETMGDAAEITELLLDAMVTYAGPCIVPFGWDATCVCSKGTHIWTQRLLTQLVPLAVLDGLPRSQQTLPFAIDAANTLVTPPPASDGCPFCCHDSQHVMHISATSFDTNKIVCVPRMTEDSRVDETPLEVPLDWYSYVNEAKERIHAPRPPLGVDCTHNKVTMAVCYVGRSAHYVT